MSQSSFHAVIHIDSFFYFFVVNTTTKISQKWLQEFHSSSDTLRLSYAVYYLRNILYKKSGRDTRSLILFSHACDWSPGSIWKSETGNRPHGNLTYCVVSPLSCIMSQNGGRSINSDEMNN